MSASHPRPKEIEIKGLRSEHSVRSSNGSLHYDPRKAADGFYTAHVKRCTAAYKSIFSDILEGRAPAVAITLHR